MKKSGKANAAIKKLSSKIKQTSAQLKKMRGQLKDLKTLAKAEKTKQGKVAKVVKAKKKPGKRRGRPAVKV